MSIWFISKDDSTGIFFIILGCKYKSVSQHVKIQPQVVRLRTFPFQVWIRYFVCMKSKRTMRRITNVGKPSLERSRKSRKTYRLYIPNLSPRCPQFQHVNLINIEEAFRRN